MCRFGNLIDVLKNALQTDDVVEILVCSVFGLLLQG